MSPHGEMPGHSRHEGLFLPNTPESQARTVLQACYVMMFTEPLVCLRKSCVQADTMAPSKFVNARYIQQFSRRAVRPRRVKVERPLELHDRADLLGKLADRQII